MPEEIESDEVEGIDEECPNVPEGLLELHVELEDQGVDPETFKEVFGNGDQAGNS